MTWEFPFVPGSYISIEHDRRLCVCLHPRIGTIPYVIVGYYNITAEDFTNQFTQYMAQEYFRLTGNFPGKHDNLK